MTKLKHKLIAFGIGNREGDREAPLSFFDNPKKNPDLVKHALIVWIHGLNFSFTM